LRQGVGRGILAMVAQQGSGVVAGFRIECGQLGTEELAQARRQTPSQARRRRCSRTEARQVLRGSWDGRAVP
jgi:hypothetical protein